MLHLAIYRGYDAGLVPARAKILSRLPHSKGGTRWGLSRGSDRSRIDRCRLAAEGSKWSRWLVSVGFGVSIVAFGAKTATGSLLAWVLFGLMPLVVGLSG